MGQRSSPESRALFAVFLLAMLPAAMALNPVLDEDVWWHLRVGQYITATGTLPEADPFTQAGVEEGAHWVVYSWLFEVALYAAYSVFGLAGVLAFRYLLACVTFTALACIATRRGTSPGPAVAALALTTVAVLPLMSERPWHFTIVGTVCTLGAVLRVRTGEPAWRFWWLPLIYVVWANTHIQFVLGLGVIGLVWVVTLVEGRRADATPGRARRLFLLGAACTIATLANPVHVRLYRVIWAYATETAALRNVTELMPPDFRSWCNWPVVVLFAWAVVVVARRGFPVWDCALLATGAFFTLRMQRDLWYGCLTALAVVSSPAPGSPLVSIVLLSSRSVAAAVLAAFVCVRVLWQVVPGPSVEAAQAKHYPVEAVRYVLEHDLKGPLFNHFDWGGYLIWNLPEMPVSIDGRTNLHGDDRVKMAVRTWAGQPGWEDDPQLRAARVIIGPRTQRLTELLLETPDRWRVVYEDELAVVFVPSNR